MPRKTHLTKLHNKKLSPSVRISTRSTPASTRNNNAMAPSKSAQSTSKSPKRKSSEVPLTSLTASPIRRSKTTKDPIKTNAITTASATHPFSDTSTLQKPNFISPNRTPRTHSKGHLKSNTTSPKSKARSTNKSKSLPPAPLFSGTNPPSASKKSTQQSIQTSLFNSISVKQEKLSTTTSNMDYKTTSKDDIEDNIDLADSNGAALDTNHGRNVKTDERSDLEYVDGENIYENDTGIHEVLNSDIPRNVDGKHSDEVTLNTTEKGKTEGPRQVEQDGSNSSDSELEVLKVVTGKINQIDIDDDSNDDSSEEEASVEDEPEEDAGSFVEEDMVVSRKTYKINRPVTTETYVITPHTTVDDGLQFAISRQPSLSEPMDADPKSDTDDDYDGKSTPIIDDSATQPPPLSTTSYKSILKNNPTSNKIQTSILPVEDQASRLKALKDNKMLQVAEAKCFRNHYSRYQVVMKAAKNPLTQEKYYLDAIDNMLTMIQLKGCEKICILPYKQKDKGKPFLTSITKLPQRLTDLEIYISNLKYQSRTINSKGQEKEVYLNVLLGHDAEPQEMLSDVSASLQWATPPVKLYRPENQAEVVTTVGWLLFSSWQMECKRIGALLTTQSGYHITARYRQISNVKTMPTFKGATTEIIKKTRAVHIECDMDIAKHVERFLTRYNGSTHDRRPRFPNGAPMRFISELQRGKLNTADTLKISMVASKQYQFVTEGLRYCALEGLMGDIDARFNLEETSDAGSTTRATSLRRLLLDINVHQDGFTNHYLFHSVEILKDEIVVLFLGKFKEEAKHLAAHLYPYMKWKFGSSLIRNYFDMATAKQYQGNDWDPVKWGVDTQLTKDLTNILQDDYFVSDTIFDFSNMQEGQRTDSDAVSVAMSVDCDANSIATIGGRSLDNSSSDSDNQSTSSPTRTRSIAFSSLQHNNSKENSAAAKKKAKGKSNKNGMSDAALLALLRNSISDDEEFAKAALALKARRAGQGDE